MTTSVGHGLAMAFVALAPGEVLRVTMPGAVFGLLLALATTRLMGSLLFGVSRLDPRTYTAVLVCAVVGALVVGSIPALRASRTDPGLTLRG